MSSLRKPLSDTDPMSELVRDTVLQQLPPHRKVELVEDANRTARLLALAGIEARHPGLTPEERYRLLMDLVLGEEMAREVYGPLSGRISS